MTVDDTRQSYVDACFRQIFDKPRGGGFGTDVAVERDGLDLFDQAGQRRGRATEGQVSTCNIQLSDKGISPSPIFCAQFLLFLFQITQKDALSLEV